MDQKKKKKKDFFCTKGKKTSQLSAIITFFSKTCPLGRALQPKRSETSKPSDESIFHHCYSSLIFTRHLRVLAWLTTTKHDCPQNLFIPPPKDLTVKYIFHVICALSAKSLESFEEIHFQNFGLCTRSLDTRL